MKLLFIIILFNSFIELFSFFTVLSFLVSAQTHILLDFLNNNKRPNISINKNKLLQLSIYYNDIKKIYIIYIMEYKVIFNDLNKITSVLTDLLKLTSNIDIKTLFSKLEKNSYHRII